MKKEEILDSIRTLASSQGFYGRLYEALSAGSEESESVLDDLERQGFNDIVDLVLYLEG